MSRYSKRQEGGTEERRQRVRGDCVIISPEHLINQRTEIVKETKWRGRDGERESFGERGFAVLMVNMCSFTFPPVWAC